MDGIENITGVEDTAAAGQEDINSGVEPLNEGAAAAGQENSAPLEAGVENQAAAGPDVEKAFAARLAAEREKIANETRDKLISDMYGASHGIHTYSDYEKAVAEYQKQQEMDRLMQQNIPKEYAEKLMKVDELERWRQEQEAERQRLLDEQARRERSTAMYSEFLQEFPDYGTEDKWKTIPPEVFADAKKWVDTDGREGRRLSDAFAKHKYLQVLKQQQAGQANADNAASSTGSARGTDAPATGFISKEVFEQNRSNKAWVMNNYEVLKKSMSKWK